MAHQNFVVVGPAITHFESPCFLLVFLPKQAQRTEQANSASNNNKNDAAIIAMPTIDKEWASSLVGLCMAVPNYWWPAYKGTGLNHGHICRVEFDGVTDERHFILQLDNKDDGVNYLMHYNAIYVYADVNDITHHSFHLPKDTVKAALSMQRAVNELNDEGRNEPLGLRIGINTGDVVAGVVGSKKFQFDIWGDAVNVAARMEQASEPGKVNVSKSTFEKVREVFDFSYRGKIEAKNKGALDMYFVQLKKEV